MASESQREAPGAESAPARKPMSRRRKKKLILVVLVIAIATVVVFWGWSSTGAKDYLQVSTLVEESSEGTIPASYLNRTIEVQGIVEGWTGGAGDLSFSLADKSDATKVLAVTLDGTLPAEFANGKTAVVKGELNSTLPLRIVATEVTIGCASRY